jgi:hypothetical protein
MFPGSRSSARRANKASAGGQLEQPSEVNSSTTTGVGAVTGILEEACASGRRSAVAATKESKMRVKTVKGCFIGVVSGLESISDPLGPKKLQPFMASEHFRPVNRYDSFDWLSDGD